MKKRIAFFLLSISLLSVLVSCGKDKTTQQKVVRPVKTIVVAQPTDTIDRFFPGKVLASEEAVLSFLISGQLIEIPINEGQSVKKNKILAKLDPIKYQEAYNEAKANYERSKAHYERAKELFRKKYLSEADYDNRRAKYLSTLSILNRTKKDLDDTVMVAPFDGVISIKYVDNYEHVQAKQKIFKLQDLSHVDIEINVPENVMVHLHKKEDKETPLTVLFDTLPNKKYSAVFKEYSAEADPETQTYKVILTMPAPKDVNILPGMTATVKTEMPNLKRGDKSLIVIPSSAVLSRNKKTFVWIVNPQSMKVKKQLVAVSRMANDEIYITRGLKPGDRIVTAGVHYLEEGQKVSLLKDNTLKK